MSPTPKPPISTTSTRSKPPSTVSRSVPTVTRKVVQEPKPPATFPKPPTALTSSGASTTSKGPSSTVGGVTTTTITAPPLRKLNLTETHAGHATQLLGLEKQIQDLKAAVCALISVLI
jgi:hypothetical protein